MPPLYPLGDVFSEQLIERLWMVAIHALQESEDEFFLAVRSASHLSRMPTYTSACASDSRS